MHTDIKHKEKKYDYCTGWMLCIADSPYKLFFRKDAAGNLLHLYYGEKIEIEEEGLAKVCEIMAPVITNQNGCSLIADTAQPNLCLDDVCLEISSRGKGI